MTRCERQSVSGRSRQGGASLRLVLSALVGAVLALGALSPASALTITSAGIYLFVEVGQSVGSGCTGCGSLEKQGGMPFSDSAIVSASTPEYVVFATAEATGSASVSNQVLFASLDLSPTASAPTPGPGPGSANQLFARTDGYISAEFSLSETTTVSLLGSVSGAVTEEAVLWGNPIVGAIYGFGTHVLPAGSYDILVQLSLGAAQASCAGCSGGTTSNPGGVEFTLFAVPESRSLVLLAASLACLWRTGAERASTGARRPG